jgi:hypothetical protein
MQYITFVQAVISVVLSRMCSCHTLINQSKYRCSHGPRLLWSQSPSASSARPSLAAWQWPGLPAVAPAPHALPSAARLKSSYSNCGHLLTILVSIGRWQCAAERRHVGAPLPAQTPGAWSGEGNQGPTCMSCSCSLMVSVLSFSSSCAMHVTYGGRSCVFAESPARCYLLAIWSDHVSHKSQRSELIGSHRFAEGRELLIEVAQRSKHACVPE